MRNFENRILRELKEEGIEAESIEIVKNGVPCKAIRICNEGSAVWPVVYYSEDETFESFLRRVRDALDNEVSNPVTLLTDSEYVADHVFLAVQKPGNEALVKKPFLNLELFMRVFIDLGDMIGTGSVKVTEPFVEQLGICADALWDNAMANIRKTSCIRSMAEILGFPDMDDGVQSLHVATTGQLTGGACVLYFPEVFRQFCEDFGETECYMLPSSTEEVIVLRGSAVAAGYLSMRDLVDMVQTINADQVDPILQLEPAVYRYSTDTDIVDIVATL